MLQSLSRKGSAAACRPIEALQTTARHAANVAWKGWKLGSSKSFRLESLDLLLRAQFEKNADIVDIAQLVLVGDKDKQRSCACPVCGVAVRRAPALRCAQCDYGPFHRACALPGPTCPQCVQPAVRMTKDALAYFLAHLHLKHDLEEIESLMARIDTNRDEEIEFEEFCYLVKNNSDIEMMLVAKIQRAAAAAALSGVSFVRVLALRRTQHKHAVQRPVLGFRGDDSASPNP